MNPLNRRQFLNRTAMVTASLSLINLSSNALAAPLKAIAKALNEDLDHHVLRRLTYGIRPGDHERFFKKNNQFERRYGLFLDEHLHPESLNDKICEGRLQSMNFATLNKDLPQLWKDHVFAADEIRDSNKMVVSAKPDLSKTGGATKDKDPLKMEENKLRQIPAQEVEMATWIRAVYSERQLFEMIVEFWHSHFSVFAYDGRIAPVFPHLDRDVIRKQALGNFRELLEAVAKSPAMLHYLDNELNQSGNPNENYARELFELHTLGAENYLGTVDRKSVPGFTKGQSHSYVDGDVYEAARAFTGWRVYQDKKGKANQWGTFEYFEPWHDRFQKIVLGHALSEYQSPLKDGHDVLDLLADHHGTSRFIARKLCRRFVSDTPDERLVQKIADVFYKTRKEKDQIKQTLFAIFRSDEFLASSGQKIKRPFEYVVGILRATEAEFTPSEPFLHDFERTGQRLFSWRTPDGLPDRHEKWLSANSLIERWRLTNQILNEQKPDLKIPALENESKQSPEEKVNQWLHRIYGGRIPEKSRNEIVTFLKSQPNSSHLRASVALMFMAPENQWR